MLRLLQSCLLFILIACFSIQAKERPKIGLVLSGGGARGAAHVGVLKILEQNQIPIDYIAGTSMGSIVGGLYASGMTVDEIEQVLLTLDWNDKLEDNANRSDHPLIRKRNEEVFSIGGRPGFREGELLLPAGLIQGQKVLPVLQDLTLHVAHIKEFKDLPIPFQAVATDIVSGNMVVMKDGDLARTMRASMAVPSIFAPVDMDEHVLVDGGLTNNLPVDIAKSMGAEIIIAVDISTPYRTKDQISNLLHITDQMTNILTGVNTQLRREMLVDGDILIQPELGDITSADFDRADEAIPIGEAEAAIHLPELLQLSLSEQEWQAHLAARRASAIPSTTINSVVLTNDSGLDDDVLWQYITIESGDKLNTSAISENLYDIHSIGNFESVSYRLDHTPEGIDLYFDAAAKSWGPNYLYFGLDMEGDLEGDTLFNMQLGYSREEINNKGGIWTSLAAIGSEPAVNTHLYQPLTHNLGPFLTASAGYARVNQAVFNDRGHKEAEYRLKQIDAGIGIGWEFSHQTAITIGIDALSGEAKVITGDETFPEPDYDDGGIFIQFKHDSMNHRDFPSKGTRIDLWAHESLEAFGVDDEYSQWRLNVARAIPIGHHRFVVGLKAGSTSGGDATIGNLFEAGGGPTLLGLDQGQLLGQHLGVAQLYYYREYEPVPLLSGYIGALLEYGGAWQTRDDISSDNAIGSGSVFVAIDTPIGPLQFGVGATDKGDINYFTRIGHLF